MRLSNLPPGVTDAIVTALEARIDEAIERQERYASNGSRDAMHRKGELFGVVQGLREARALVREIAARKDGQ